MSLNTAHASNGVLIHSGEYILLFSDSVSMNFVGSELEVFEGTKQGRIYLTSHRMIFNSKNQSDSLQSFSFPFVALSDMDLEQPVFGANYIRGKVRAQPNGNWTGEVKFKLYFKAGGAIDFGQALLRAASTTQYNRPVNDAPPPYTPPTGSWYEAPPPAYQAPPGYYGWLPSNEEFTAGPPPNTVYMSDNPPPYPGIGSSFGGPGPMQQQPQGYPGAPPQQMYPANPAYPGNPGAPYQQAFAGGYSQPINPNYPQMPPAVGYGYPADPNTNPTAPSQAMGFQLPTSTVTKETEANIGGYHSSGQNSYQEPRESNQPPGYNSLNKKQL